MNPAVGVDERPSRMPILRRGDDDNGRIVDRIGCSEAAGDRGRGEDRDGGNDRVGLQSACGTAAVWGRKGMEHGLAQLPFGQNVAPADSMTVSLGLNSGTRLAEIVRAKPQPTS